MAMGEGNLADLRVTLDEVQERLFPFALSCLKLDCKVNTKRSSFCMYKWMLGVSDSTIVGLRWKRQESKMYNNYKGAGKKNLNDSL